MREDSHRHSAAGISGLILHAAAGYDLLAWLLLRGRERAFRERLVKLARIEPGESVLDVGCGTGSLALEAKRRVGSSGSVRGIDASPEMISRARAKAARAGMDVAFDMGVVESLPFPGETFDVVLSTLMLHHLPRAARVQCAREIRRVLKPGGRVFVADFGRVTRVRKSFFGRFHRHGGVEPDAVVELLRETGFEVVQRGAVGVRDVNFVLGVSR